MEAEILYASEVPQDTLLHLLTTERELQGTIFLGESLPPSIVEPGQRQSLLAFLNYHDQIAWANYQTGRLFHPDFELRWEQVGETTWQVVYMGKDHPWIQAHFKQPLATLAERQTREYYLFGKPLKQEIRGLKAKQHLFAEARISRILDYQPAPPEKEKQSRVCLVTYEYLNSLGLVQASRFVSLKRVV